MSVLITHIRKCETTAGAAKFLDNEKTKAGTIATTLLIDEVEEIWSKIADHDDWSALDNKIADIRDYGRLISLLGEQ